MYSVPLLQRPFVYKVNRINTIWLSISPHRIIWIPNVYKILGFNILPSSLHDLHIFLSIVAQVLCDNEVEKLFFVLELVGFIELNLLLHIVDQYQLLQYQYYYYSLGDEEHEYKQQHRHRKLIINQLLFSKNIISLFFIQKMENLIRAYSTPFQRQSVINQPLVNQTINNEKAKIIQQYGAKQKQPSQMFQTLQKFNDGVQQTIAKSKDNVLAQNVQLLDQYVQDNKQNNNSYMNNNTNQLQKQTNNQQSVTVKNTQQKQTNVSYVKKTPSNISLKTPLTYATIMEEENKNLQSECLQTVIQPAARTSNIKKTNADKRTFKQIDDDEIVEQQQQHVEHGIEEEQMNNDNQEDNIIDDDAVEIVNKKQVRPQQQSVGRDNGKFVSLNPFHQKPVQSKQKSEKIWEPNFFIVAVEFPTLINEALHAKRKWILSFQYIDGTTGKKHRKKIRFGRSGVNDFIDHHDVKQKEKFMKNLRNAANPFKANFWSLQLLNNKDSLEDNYIEMIKLIHSKQIQ